MQFGNLDDVNLVENHLHQQLCMRFWDKDTLNWTSAHPILRDGSYESLEAPEGIWAGYTKQPWPMGGYAALIGAYLAGGSALLASAAKPNRLPGRIKTRDILLLGVATHKLTRINQKPKSARS